LLKGIDGAKESVDILIFRFDRPEIERALLNAVGRGVRVRALIAYTNRGGEKQLRALETRLLAAGITVARTAGDLVRYHGKMIIVDAREVYVLAFNFTYLDMDHSRSFGVITENRRLVQEALKLFEADVQRQPYAPGAPGLVVSPLNAREELAAFIGAARRELLIYDPNVSDAAMLRLLHERAKAGVSIRIIGRAAKLASRKLAQMRLHTRVMVRDGSHVFVGSQSLRTIELDKRREIGLLLRDSKMASRLVKVFARDWELTEPRGDGDRADEPVTAAEIAKRVAKAVAKELPPVAEVLDIVVKEVGGDEAVVPVDTDQLQDVVKDAVKDAVKHAVLDAVEDSAKAEGAGKGK
jgi:phosphatidylserine/phosphatidylglycerophosphate/cardiolipin synthase-like enzyme